MDVIFPENVEENKIYMNLNVVKRLQLTDCQVVPVSFGSLKVYKEIVITKDLGDGTIGMSSIFKSNLILPTDPYETRYEAVLNEGVITIGPLIGMLLTRSHEKITPQKLSIIKERIPPNFHGIVLVGSHDWIDIKKKVMKGYYYTKKGTWRIASFPFPTVIYNRVYLKKKKLKKIIRKTKGLHIFNNCLMTKTKLWKLLSKDVSVNRHLPMTQLLKDINSFLIMAEHFNVVYLKPSNLSRGRGVLQAKKDNTGFRLKDTNNREHTFKCIKELEQFLFYLTKNQKYVIQQGVPYTYKQSLIDFRAYMQKDATKSWNCSGVYGRVSRPGGIVTNLTFSQNIIPLEDSLQKYYHLKQEQINTLKEDIVQVFKKVCQALEKKGEILGDLAIDFVIDETLKIWVLEVQINYAADERLYQLPLTISKRVWQTPLLYAKTLAGF